MRTSSIQLARQNAEQISKDLKAKAAGQWIRKADLKVHYSLPHVRSCQVFAILETEFGFEVSRLEVRAPASSDSA